MTQKHQRTPQRVLLVGCGQVGTELGQRLVAEGAQVYGLRRDTRQLPADFEPLSVDLLQQVTQSLPTVDAMVITLTPSIKDSTGANGYLTALHQLAQALPQVPPRVLFVSSTRVFEGANPEQVMTESDPVAPVSERGETLVAGEALATQLFNAHIVRPAGIYGPGREMLLRKVLDHQPVQYARRTNRIHQTDLVRALHTLLMLDTAPNVLHAIDRTPGVLLGDVVKYLADRLDVAPPPPVEPAQSSGRILSGDRLAELVGALTYPTYRHGYDQIIAARETTL